jgi:hypothetical protein
VREREREKEREKERERGGGELTFWLVVSIYRSRPDIAEIIQRNSDQLSKVFILVVKIY